jgi:SAM-dependent methyltransferase
MKNEKLPSIRPNWVSMSEVRQMSLACPARPCPICGGAGSKTLYRQSFEQLSGARLLNGYVVAICESCGAGFAADIPDQCVFDDYYRDLSKYDYADHGGIEPPEAEQRFQDIAAILKDFIPAAESRILEIGSASGQLLRVLRERGYADVLGADPSPGCVRAAAALYGIPGIVGSIFDLPAPDQSYDFLILVGVMEHIRDLDRAVECFHGLLSKGGRVYLEVPDASRYVHCVDAPFQEFSMEHINFFSRISLTNLMQSRGFRTVASGHAIRPQHEVTCPATWGVFEKTSEPQPTERDSSTEAGLRVYVDGCAAEDARIRSVIESALKPGERMTVWGVGAHTLRLLATGGIDAARVALFVDSNPKYQRQRLCGVPVVAPGEIGNRPEPILISSRGFQEEIRRQIEQGLGLRNSTIVLYSVPAAS